MFDEPERVAAWAKERLPNFIGWSGYYQAIGRERNGELDAAVVYTNAAGNNIVASIVLERPLTKQFLRAVLHYPFWQLRMHRITVLVEEWNERSFGLCEHLGFMVEGRMRGAASDGGDIIVMGLLKSECKWL